jgi:hypothetical protein
MKKLITITIQDVLNNNPTDNQLPKGYRQMRDKTLFFKNLLAPIYPIGEEFELKLENGYCDFYTIWKYIGNGVFYLYKSSSFIEWEREQKLNDLL